MIILRVIVIKPCAIKIGQEKPVDAFIMMQWLEAKLVKTYQGRARENRQARNSPGERRNIRRLNTACIL